MLKPLLAECKKRVSASDLIAAIRYRLRYPGLHVSQGARIRGEGQLAYGPGCSVGTGTAILLNPGSRFAMGEGCRIDSDVEIQPDRGAIELGDETSIQKRCALIGDISVGSYCLFAPNVFISSGVHQFDLHPELLIRDQDDMALSGSAAEYNRKVAIGEDCWVGANVVIMRGVTIGKGCIIGANAVVTRDIPPYSVAAGAPARVIRKRLDFSPRSSIEAGRRADLPYFYAGFSLREKGRDSFAVKNSFTLCLAPPPGARILRLRISGDSSGEHSVCHRGMERKAGPGSLSCEFPFLPDAPGGLYAFTVSHAAGSPENGLRIRGASVE